MPLTDALDTPAADHISFCTGQAYDQAINCLISAYNIWGTPDFLFNAYPLTDAPKNARERRHDAIAVLSIKWRWQENAEGIRADLEAMRTLGRTERWQRTINGVLRMLDSNPDAGYALVQGCIYLDHAA